MDLRRKRLTIGQRIDCIKRAPVLIGGKPYVAIVVVGRGDGVVDSFSVGTHPVANLVQSFYSFGLDKSFGSRADAENKDFGPCYVRGITEGEQNPNDSCAWLTYSVNKEDIWVSRIQLPARTCWQGPVGDDFAQTAPSAPIKNWNIYRPKWADVYIDEAHQLCMVDSDRYDYARAIRVFEATKRVKIAFDYMVQAENDDPFEVDVTDRHGDRAVSFSFHRGEIRMGGEVVGHYRPQTWEHFSVTVSALGTGTYIIGGTQYANLHAVEAVERLSLRTGKWRNLPNRHTPNQDKCPPLDGCDEATDAAKYLIKDVKIVSALVE